MGVRPRNHEQSRVSQVMHMIKLSWIVVGVQLYLDLVKFIACRQSLHFLSSHAPQIGLSCLDKSEGYLSHFSGSVLHLQKRVCGRLYGHVCPFVCCSFFYLFMCSVCVAVCVFVVW